MTFAEAAMIMMSGDGAKPNIQPLNVTANGKYSAADYGYDGFDPVNVNVPDRYDEGYEKGYNDGSDLYKKLYEKEKGNGETVTDIAGNPIENAIVVDNLDSLNNYLKLTTLNEGESVTITNLGADTSIRIQYKMHPYDAYGAKRLKLHVFTRNLNTGKEYEQITDMGLSAIIPAGAKGTIKIEDISFVENYTIAYVTYRIYIDGKPWGGALVTERVTYVNGTAFATPNADYAYS